MNPSWLLTYSYLKRNIATAIGNYKCIVLVSDNLSYGYIAMETYVCTVGNKYIM